MWLLAYHTVHWQVLTFKNKPANVDQGIATNHTVAAMCTCPAEGKILLIYFTVPLDQLSKFSVVNEEVNQYQPVRDTAGNQYTGTESGNMNNDELIKFIEDIIVEHTHTRPTSCIFLDSLGYQHNSRTLEVCNKHNITVYRIPPNTSGWLQPCDIVLFGPAKQKSS